MTNSRHIDSLQNLKILHNLDNQRFVLVDLDGFKKNWLRQNLDYVIPNYYCAFLSPKVAGIYNIKVF